MTKAIEILFRIINVVKKDFLRYHVAHPNTPCIILGKKFQYKTKYGSDYILCVFSEPVNFKSNPFHGPSHYWECCLDLLYTSMEEAQAKHIPFY